MARTIVPSGIWRALGFAAAAAAVMLVGAAATRVTAPVADRADVVEALPIDALPPAAASGERELLSLREGDVLESGAEPLRFGHDKVVSWSLAPHSRAVVRSLGKAAVGSTLALERGSVRAEVTPRDPSEGLVEAFAVEVEGTRVAVHGTAFSVTRAEGGVLVDVEHGTVAVGPVGHVGETSGRILVGPSRALVSLDGGQAARWLPRTESVASRQSERVANASPIAPSPATDRPADVDGLGDGSAPRSVEGEDPVASPRVVVQPNAKREVEPAAPTAAPAARELSRAGIEGQLSRCFTEVYGKPGEGVSFSVTGSFRVSLYPDGSVKGARFEPPLRPELANCMGRGALDGRFPAGTTEVVVPVHFGK